ncbi:hypothetical protein ES332_A01G147600v1 [Gossypium tomentosum]|uniref:Phosphoglycerate mutase-like protein n=1 Tax=Gossypium tomentosum TaxID=34277 RepID=A0A5D2RQK4_GOSTO|nr:hypothetical protein ES332_A01G147600v1 [Gossypium tomentosum]
MTVSIFYNIPSPSSSSLSSFSCSSSCFLSIASSSIPFSNPKKPIQLSLSHTSASLSDMDVISSPGLYPLHRCKTLHLVRHAQGVHNVEGEKDHAAYLSESLFDAHLTPLGWQQVDHLRKHVHETGLSKKIELVIVSPLLRESIHVIEEKASIASDEDNLWEANSREKNEEVAVRGMKFLNWLWTRKEREIAIVTHSGFLNHTLSVFGNDCHPSVKSEICTHFANCELRSVVIVDRSMMGSDPATTNYPGKIPSGLDLPSDVADEKLLNDGEGK